MIVIAASLPSMDHGGCRIQFLVHIISRTVGGFHIFAMDGMETKERWEGPEALFDSGLEVDPAVHEHEGDQDQMYSEEDVVQFELGLLRLVPGILHSGHRTERTHESEEQEGGLLGPPLLLLRLPFVHPSVFEPRPPLGRSRPGSGIFVYGGVRDLPEAGLKARVADLCNGPVDFSGSGNIRQKGICHLL